MDPIDQAPAPQRLTESPDWIYLLREFEGVYNTLSGGSDPIRTHRRIVRNAIARTIKANVEVKSRVVENKPVTAHLKRAFDLGRVERTSALLRSIENVSHLLTWEYGYEKIPRGLAKRFAYTVFAGPTGPVCTEAVVLGAVLFGPGCIYPTHAHDGIEESYICLSGAMSQNNQGVYAPGSMIFNPPSTPHRITVSEKEPSLLAYAWIGPAQKLHAQKMVFSKAKPKV